MGVGKRRSGVVGDPDDAFEAFFRQRGAALFRFSVILTGDENAAADLLQTVLARVYARWAVGPWPAAPDAYMRTALVHAAGQFWRRRSTSREVLVADPPETVASAVPADLPLRGALLAALRRLPVRQWAVVALRYFEDFSEREVAQILDCQVGTVKSQAHRALRKLRADPQLAGFFDTVMET
jgi:RNA polymerase sigma-70 factor (sigma-E family)